MKELIKSYHVNERRVEELLLEEFKRRFEHGAYDEANYLQKTFKLHDEKLRKVREALHQEWAHLQIVGRTLTPEEMQRSDALGKAVELIDQAWAVLEAGS